MMFGHGWIWMLLAWVVVIAAIVWAVAALAPVNRGDDRRGPDRARQVLDERFASGEIDVDEYRRRRDELVS